MAWLRDRGVIFNRNGGPVANQRLIDRGLFTVVWEEHAGKLRPKTKVTGRGIVHHAKALNVKPPVGPS